MQKSALGTGIKFSVFTKPWKDCSIDSLGAHIQSLGFDGIEFPLREGFQVALQNSEKGLVQLVDTLNQYKVQVFSVASELEENIFAGCASAGIPVIRICYKINKNSGYIASIDNFKKDMERVLSLCEKYQVQVAIQPHYGYNIQNSVELYNLIQKYPLQYIAIAWDAAHSALVGELPELALEAVWSHLSMINLKNAYYIRSNGPEAKEAEWKTYFTTGKHGLASWRNIAKVLTARQYQGVICLTAEYSLKDEVDRLIREDIGYAMELFK